MKRMEELLNGSNDHHLFPFFWQKGEDASTIATYIQKMYEQGLRGFCVESRNHPDFCGPSWWEAMDVILDEAGKRDMQVWILDDQSFPTGVANHKVPEELKKRYLACHRFDFEGAGEPQWLNVAMPAGMRGLGSDRRHMTDRLVACVMVENDLADKDSFVESSLIDLSDSVEEGLLTLPPVSGPHSVFVLYETVCGAEAATKDHLDPMRAEATQVLLDEVYEPHFAHYGHLFGTTIRAFFSDEPRFGNGKGRQEIVGKTDSPLPWNEGVQAALTEREVTRAELALLFAGDGPRAHEVHFAYMDVVSDLYSRNFSQVIGAWCAAHGVSYVGHVIEDDNAHARLAQGPGHYFRGIAGQDAAGIDVIGGQVVPGMDYAHDAFSTGGSDGEFYHYALARMAASAGKLDPRKQGRVMCEAFGAYGWVEGLKMMKWIGDHLLSQGVNLFVPHAFDMAPFPDWDCPPHFYAHGMNPQFGEFGRWASYADRLCHLLSGGHKVARIGVLYHAFAEWSGGSQYFQKPCKALQQAQLDSDVISEDWLLGASVEEERYVINGFGYDALVVPAVERLPEVLAAQLTDLAAAGVDVVYVDTRPGGCIGGRVVALDELGGAFERLRDVRVDSLQEHLAFLHYQHADGEAWFFFNEDVKAPIDADVTLDAQSSLAEYDAFENRLYAIDATDGAFHLHLEPYESLMVVTGHAVDRKPCAGRLLQTVGEAAVALRPYDADTFNAPQVVRLAPGTVSPTFSGTMRYEFYVELADPKVLLVLPAVGEVSRVWVNSVSCGSSITPRATYDLSSGATAGTNHVVVEVINTLGNAQRDFFSMYLPIEQAGLLAPIAVHKLAR